MEIREITLTLMVAMVTGELIALVGQVFSIKPCVSVRLLLSSLKRPLISSFTLSTSKCRSGRVHLRTLTSAEDFLFIISHQCQGQSRPSLRFIHYTWWLHPQLRLKSIHCLCVTETVRHLSHCRSLPLH